jgi:peptide/nickel transport system substrate-binding protein
MRLAKAHLGHPTNIARESTMKIARFTGLAAGAALVASTALAVAPTTASAQTTIRAVMHSDLKILDPIWTTAYIVRNHGYMIYDTLFAVDANQTVQPQMVDKYTISDDKLTYTFTLRDGLLWHDGQPVTSEDCIASIKRWAQRDTMGQKLMSYVDKLEPVDNKTFKLVLKEKYGLVLESLGKPSSNVPFMMPKRVAETSAAEQISDQTGSGPFVFKKDEWKPGEKTVYVKFDKYKPRSEPASSVAGGKVVKVDRVEWVAIPDGQTAVNALLNKEIDLMEAPKHDLYPVLKDDKDIVFFNWNKLGNQYVLRLNHLHPPFNNQKIREALTYAIAQEEYLQATIGDPEFYKVCGAMFVCGTPLAQEPADGRLVKPNIEKAKALLREAGYDGTPVVLMQSTDLDVLTNLAPVAKAQMERIGLKVEMQSMDWQTLVARRTKKEPPSAGGWNAFLTSWVSVDILNPISTAYLNSACDKAPFGWPCDEVMEKMRDEYARETDPAKQKELALKIQQRALDYGTYAWVGQWYGAGVYRKGVIDGWLEAPAPVFWNMTKKGS